MNWLLETFPWSKPPDPAFIPDDSTLPAPRRGDPPEARVESPSLGEEQESKSGPGSKGVPQTSRAHTGFDFDYTPREASRIERRSSRSKSRLSEGERGGTPRSSAPGSPSKAYALNLADAESNEA